MPERRFGNPLLVNNKTTYEQMIDHLSERRLLAIDTESDSLYRYYPRVCLIQISTYTDPDVEPGLITDYLVDPLRHQQFDDLRPLLADSEREVIMHASENDISLLQREFQFSFGRVFDTQLAARIMGWKKVGLAAILEENFGVVSNKQMQRTNWGRRPLTPEQISYAQMDTHYLPALRKNQKQQLMAVGRWEEAQEAFQMLVQIDYRNRQVNERSFWQMKETRSVPRESTGVLEALWLWREQEAKRMDWPPFKVLTNRVLVELATEEPAQISDLYTIHGLSESGVKRHGRALLDVIADGRLRSLPPLPEPTLRPERMLNGPTVTHYDNLRRWRSTVAQDRGVAPDLVFSNDILLEIAKRHPRTEAELQTIPQIGPWKAKTYGPAVLAVLSV